MCFIKHLWALLDLIVSLYFLSSLAPFAQTEYNFIINTKNGSLHDCYMSTMFEKVHA